MHSRKEEDGGVGDGEVRGAGRGRLGGSVGDLGFCLSGPWARFFHVG